MIPRKICRTFDKNRSCASIFRKLRPIFSPVNFTENLSCSDYRTKVFRALIILAILFPKTFFTELVAFPRPLKSLNFTQTPSFTSKRASQADKRRKVLLSYNEARCAYVVSNEKTLSFSKNY